MLGIDITESTIKALFEPHGKVDLVNIPRDRMTQKPRGFAFVDMSTKEELEAAINAVDGTELENRSVRVMKSVNKDEVGERKVSPKRERSNNTGMSAGPPPGTKKIYVGNIPFSVSKDELKDFYTEYGEVVDVFIPSNPETGEGRGFAFVTMKEEDFMKAIEGTNGVEFGGRTLVVNEPLPPGKKAPIRSKTNGTKLYVGNLSFYTVAQTLYDIFGEFGEVLDCYLPEDSATGSSRGFGFVTMAPEDAARAIKEIDGCEVDGRVIRVNEAQPKGRASASYNNNNNNDMGAEEMGVISDSWNDMDDQ
jgi:RNA recognition motif-containing protein